MASKKPVETATAKATKKLADATVHQRVVSVEGEAERLWKHVLFGTGTCVGMIEGYARLGVPGDPASDIRVLIERLNGVIHLLENRNARQPIVKN